MHSRKLTAGTWTYLLGKDKSSSIHLQSLGFSRSFSGGVFLFRNLHRFSKKEPFYPSNPWKSCRVLNWTRLRLDDFTPELQFSIFILNLTPEALLQSCTKQEEDKASTICQKYLGTSDSDAKMSGSDVLTFQETLADCIFDICVGGGEAAAELAAEILNAF